MCSFEWFGTILYIFIVVIYDGLVIASCSKCYCFFLGILKMNEYESRRFEVEDSLAEASSWQNISRISENLCVHPSTVKRIVDLFKSTGNVGKKTYCKDGFFKKLTPTVEMIILTTVVQQPGIKLRELQAQLGEYKIEVRQSTICSFLHKNGFSYQKNGFNC